MRPMSLLRLGALPIIALLLADPSFAEKPLVVGSKNFAENRLLAEMFAQLIEAKTELTVERRLNLAGTQVCFDALRSKAIDLYPEYTGTGLVSLLEREPEQTPAATLNVVRREFQERWNLRWLAPLGFENAYEVTVPAALARRLGMTTISDLAKHSQDMRAGFGFEFVSRNDGLPGLEALYGLRFKTVRSLQQALKYQAVANEEIDVLDAYTTDGRLLVHDLQILIDDLGFFPSYQAAALVRSEVLDSYPEVGRALGLLEGTLDADLMRSLNYRLQEGGENFEAVATDALTSLRLIDGQGSLEELSSNPNFVSFLWQERRDLLIRTAEHLRLSLIALLLGAAVAIPFGLFLLKLNTFAETAIRLLGITQTIPSIALLAFMIPLLGIGFKPDSTDTDTDNVVLKLDYQAGDYTLTSITGWSEYQGIDSVDVDWLPLQFISRDDDQTFEQFSQEFRITSPGGEFFDYVAGFYYEESELAFDGREIGRASCRERV